MANSIRKEIHAKSLLQCPSRFRTQKPIDCDIVLLRIVSVLIVVIIVNTGKIYDL